MYDLTHPAHDLVVFEIDNSKTMMPHFMAMIGKATARAEISHPVEFGLGHWEGKTSTCIVMAAHDFDQLVRRGTMRLYVCKQDALMWVFKDKDAEINKNDLDLRYGSHNLTRGAVQKVNPAFLGKHAGWTALQSGFYTLIEG